jgi:small subunit ribosomal protein S7
MQRFIVTTESTPDELLKKFTNCVMKEGKKSIAVRIIEDSFQIIKERNNDPMTVFMAALENIYPRVEVKSKRVGGANYQIPIEVNSRRKVALAVRWILDAARRRKGRSMHKALADELMEASENTGSAVKKKEDVHRMAEANKAFAHFAKF